MQNNTRNSKAKIFIFGAIIGAVIFLFLYGFGPLNPFNDHFIINGYIEKDIAQHYAGWMLYRDSPWQFPLGVGQNIAYPYGTAVSYTDSIPLFAILFKALNFMLPATFQYFGLFVFLCFILQGGFGALLASLFTSNIILSSFSAAILVFSPIMIERAFRHCGLTAHFLILAALYYYFESKQKKGLTAYLPFFIINILAITIHPYFLPFTFGILFAFCLERFFIKKEYSLSILSLLSSILSALATGYAIGAFYVKGNMSAIGYGYYSMNLNALYNPISRGFENWSGLLEIKPNVLGQIEGFNYLGLGVFVFLAICILIFIVCYRKTLLITVFSFIKQYFGLIFSATALIIFALGDWITFGGLPLFRIPYPDGLIYGLFGIFRANGRFGNILVYLITLFIIFVVIKCCNKKTGIVLFICLIGMQVFDMRGVLISKYNYFHNKEENLQGQICERYLTNPFWDEAMEKYEKIIILENTLGNGCIDLTIKAAKNNLVVNTQFEARIDTALRTTLIEQEKEKIFSHEVPDDTLYLEYYLPPYKELVESGKLQAFLVDEQILITKPIFTPQEIERYTSFGNFAYLTAASPQFTQEYYQVEE